MGTKSWLVTSPINPKFMDKISSIDCDVIIIDLEDSIPISKKHTSREILSSLPTKNITQTLSVRINPISSIHGLKDIWYLSENKIFPDILVVPKPSLPRDIEIISSVLNCKENGIKIYPVIESIRSLHEFINLNYHVENLDGVFFGAADFSSDMGVNYFDTNLSVVKSELVLNAKKYRIDAIASPCFNIRSRDRLYAQAIESKQFGFDGMVAIHPNQVSIINDVFSVSKDEKKWAEGVNRLVGCDESASVAEINGDMIGPPFLNYAKKILKKAKGDCS